jgi:hypothetical protein
MEAGDAGGGDGYCLWSGEVGFARLPRQEYGGVEEGIEFESASPRHYAGDMPPPIPGVLAAFDSAWPRIAAGHAEAHGVLGLVLLAVHPIGSTAMLGVFRQFSQASTI